MPTRAVRYRDRDGGGPRVDRGESRSGGGAGLRGPSANTNSLFLGGGDPRALEMPPAADEARPGGDHHPLASPAMGPPPTIVSWRAIPLVGIPVAAIVVALALGTFIALDYVHVILGALWTGIDLFMGLVIGPILGRMSGPARADFVQRLIPTMLFLMPTIASVTITAGIYLAIQAGIFQLDYLAIQLAGLFVIVLSVQGFGIFLPNEVRIVLELRRPRPDIAKIGRLGLMNARLAGVQAAFQIALIFVMANLAAGNVAMRF